PKALGANDRVTLALIGGKNRGWQVAREALKNGAVFKTFCDIDEAVQRDIGGKIADMQDKAPGVCTQYEDVFNDKDIDAVIIATPDHWHARQAIHACQAGKDVYIEKPLTKTIEEGRLIRDAARKYKRIMQAGLQRRSTNYCDSAAEYVAGGNLGKLCEIKAWMCQTRGSIGNPPDGNPPQGVDYDRWLGPAPKRPFNPMRFHYNWRFFWDYCNSELGNQGIHMLDICMKTIQKMRGLQNCLPVHISNNSGIYWLDDMKEVPDTQIVTYDYEDFMLVWELRSFGSHRPVEGSSAGIGFYGSEAALIVNFGKQNWTVYRKDGSTESSESDRCNETHLHMKNFLECIQSRRPPNADVELGRLSTTICHLGNISHHLGRDVHFNPKAENFDDDQPANALLRREYREPYGLPAV
ncbi:MAG: Gfo/Idh/MocA family protein, partial [Candidatus Hinthialibacter sp.]